MRCLCLSLSTVVFANIIHMYTRYREREKERRIEVLSVSLLFGLRHLYCTKRKEGERMILYIIALGLNSLLLGSYWGKGIPRVLSLYMCDCPRDVDPYKPTIPKTHSSRLLVFLDAVRLPRWTHCQPTPSLSFPLSSDHQSSFNALHVIFATVHAVRR